MQQTKLLSSALPSEEEKQPRCTFIFDREAYEPAFFVRLWEKYRISVITYRKNVKDNWSKDSFETIDTKVLDQTVTMLLCERNVTLGGHSFREIRRLTDNQHQTAIISTHPTIYMAEIAGRMFGRWSQENFFRYLIADYDFDKMIEFGTQSIDPEQKVVNPEYRKLNYKLKKLREKKQRLEAKFYPLAEQVMDQNIDQTPLITRKQAEYKETLDQYQLQEMELIKLRKQQSPKITLREMPENQRFNKLKTESKLLMNIIKMICYRAESSVAAQCEPYLSRHREEKRMFIKQIIANNADIIPDNQNKTLTVRLHSLSAQRYNRAAQHLAVILNQTKTIFPGTDLRLVFKTTASSNCEK